MYQSSRLSVIECYQKQNRRGGRRQRARRPRTQRDNSFPFPPPTPTMAAAFASQLFSTASSLVSQSAVSSHYTLSSSLPSSSSSSSARAVTIGVWKVDRAVHNTNGKVVSVWSCDKAHLAGSGRGASGSAGARRIEKAVEVLKKEASSLSRLRHPCILEMAEPMEETRSTITFATEPVTASLHHAIAASSSAADSARRGSRAKHEEDELELDEVEIQKGVSQLAKGLQFLHESAKLVHGNLTPDAVIINAKGDWKLSGFGLSTYLFNAEGIPAKWEFPEYDPSLPSSCQRDYDYIAPEYILDESPPAPSNDLYSLGCILHSIHTHTGPPFSNRHNLENARANMEEGLSRGMVRSSWRKLPDEVQAVLSQLFTRYPSSRLSASAFLAHSYFSSLLVSTLRFLERDSFAAQSSEAQASFLKGLVAVLPRFSDKVNRRKVLPSLLEESRKAGLVPFLLPNILYIGGTLDADAFRAEVLPQLKPLFATKDPPQAVIALLDKLPLFIEKCSPTVFREEVMPLVYNALDSENPAVLEKALRVVPGLSETLDYTTVKQTLFPQITAVFSKTTMLSVKVNTLICFHSMIKTLDKFTLTEKLVPLLAKIKTKEPSVMVATLAVHEEMGKKCEIEAIATLILPQLWAMSMGPLLNLQQYQKFMAVIKRLGTRVEQEHSQQLGELRRLEETSGGSSSRGGGMGIGSNGEIDFESLVRGGVGAKKEVQQDMWADDSSSGSGSHTPNVFSSPAPTPTLSPATRAPRLAPTSSSKAASLFGARLIPSTSFNASTFPPPASSFPVMAPPVPRPSNGGLGSFAAMQPSRPAGASSMGGMTALGAPPSKVPAQSSSYGTGRPNYDLSLPSQAPSHSPSAFTSHNTYATPLQPQQPLQPPRPPQPASNGWNVVAPPPGFGMGILQPTQAPKKAGTTPNFGDWADLDPLR